MGKIDKELTDKVKQREFFGGPLAQDAVVAHNINQAQGKCAKCQKDGCINKLACKEIICNDCITV